MTPEKRKELLDCILTIENTRRTMCTTWEDKQSRDVAGVENYKAWNRLYKMLDIIASRSSAFDEFYTDASCLFAEGVEFMDKIQLYDAFKEGFLKLQEKLK